MAAIYQAWGTNNQSFTITPGALAASATVGRSSAVLSVPTTNVLDLLIFAQFILTTGTIGGSRAVYVYAYGSVDGGTTYTDGVAGTDAGFTRTDPPNLLKVGQVNFTAQSQTKSGGPWSLAAAFGGVLPERVGVVIFNDTGIALVSSATNFVKYQAVYATSL